MTPLKIYLAPCIPFNTNLPQFTPNATTVYFFFFFLSLCSYQGIVTPYVKGNCISIYNLFRKLMPFSSTYHSSKSHLTFKALLKIHLLLEM